MKARMLLVEDNPVDAEVIKRVAHKAQTDFEVTLVGTFDDAISKLADPDGYDIVLTDFCLPGPNDGADLAREAHTHTVVMTGLTPSEVERRALRAGALAVVSKESLARDPEILDGLIRRTQEGPPGRGTSAVEDAQRREIEQLKAHNATLAKARGGFLGFLDWCAAHPALVGVLLGTLGLVIIAAMVIGSWPIP